MAALHFGICRAVPSVGSFLLCVHLPAAYHTYYLTHYVFLEYDNVRVNKCVGMKTIFKVKAGCGSFLRW